MFSLKRHLGSQGVPDDVIDGIRKAVATDDGILFDVQAEVGLFVGCTYMQCRHTCSHTLLLLLPAFSVLMKLLLLQVST